jgi:hypothetical protein
VLAILMDLGEEFNAIFDKDDATFVGIAQGLYRKGIVPRIFALVLKAYNPNPFRAVVNRFWMWRYKLTPANIVNSMKTSEWMEVLPSGSLSDLMSSTSGSPASEANWMTMIFQLLAGVSQMRKGFITPQPETLVNRESSDARRS